ncbi:efflux RND transporter permease subunit [Marinicella litoralis]|uniref:Multidrug efflux pump subunit AcrB n=1 Tax=Marinicella litoralis TaxID=644220 RepID=A0A4R6XGQ8_9GAMM|nr:efflux RND transporter permease subunit [Marinicella litoralis]TDR17469.1 multidrug efflux pump subunit AcrB [Marinicella litoralis]
MSVVRLLVDQKRLILTTSIFLALFGLFSWSSMNRQEDPFFPYRQGFVLVQYPGADVNKIEKQVLKPLEEELAQIEEIDEIRATVRSGFVQVIVKMLDHITDTDLVWDRVRRAVDKAKVKFPDGVLEPSVEDRLLDTAVAVYSLSGINDIMQLREQAKSIKNRMFNLPGIGKVALYGMPDEQVTITLKEAFNNSSIINHELIAKQINERTKAQPINALHVGNNRINLDAHTEFKSIEEIKNTSIELTNGEQLPLSMLAEVKLEAENVSNSGFWHHRERAIALALYVPINQLNVVDFGKELRTYMEQIRKIYPEVKVEEVFFQPDQVVERLQELGGSLLTGMILVTIILAFFLGLRPGLVVATVIPLVTFSSLALFNLGGGVLHQMAIAGMVIGLGMLVDNAIVMVESIQYHIDEGMRGSDASVTSVRNLAMSLGSATGTTIAAFMPMLLSDGNSADFTRAIPTMIILSITVSYVYAILVTPAFSHIFLKQHTENQSSSLQKLGHKLGQIAVGKTNVIILGAVIFLVLSGYMFTFVQRDFFPDTDRNQVIIDIKYPENSHIIQNTRNTQAIATQLAERDHVDRTVTFVGNSGPVFYYNLVEKPRSPHIARIVAIIDDVANSHEIIQWVTNEVSPSYPQAEIVARRLGQGPPADAPIEIKVIAEDRRELTESIRKIQDLLSQTEGTRTLRNTIGLGMAKLTLSPHDDLLNKNDITRDELASGLALRTSGQVIGQYRGSEDPVNIVMQAPEHVNFNIQNLDDISIHNGDYQLSLNALTDKSIDWLPASIQHINLQRTASVYSETKEGYTYDDVLAEFLPKLDSIDFPAGVEYYVAGAVKESGKANQSLGKALPIGIIMLLIFLLFEFNSFKKMLIILVTVPLAFAGVPFGLLLTSTPFGFTATLGVLALVGIVVNNAIVLLDLIQRNQDSGMSMKQSIEQAVARRTRPIVLTTLTTIAGLLPLVMTRSTLWPPLAWSIISGLIVSTALSLLVVPSMYQKMIKPK